MTILPTRVRRCVVVCCVALRLELVCLLTLEASRPERRAMIIRNKQIDEVGCLEATEVMKEEQLHVQESGCVWNGKK